MLLRQRGLKQGWIEFGQHLPGFHLLVEVGLDALDRARHLGADVDQRDRVEVPLADTWALISPRSTASVRNCGSPGLSVLLHHQPAAAAISSNTTIPSFFIFVPSRCAGSIQSQLNSPIACANSARATRNPSCVSN